MDAAPETNKFQPQQIQQILDFKLNLQIQILADSSVDHVFGNTNNPNNTYLSSQILQIQILFGKQEGLITTTIVWASKN